MRRSSLCIAQTQSYQSQWLVFISDKEYSVSFCCWKLSLKRLVILIIDFVAGQPCVYYFRYVDDGCSFTVLTAPLTWLYSSTHWLRQIDSMFLFTVLFFFFLYCWRVSHSDVEICFHPTSTGFLCRSANWYVDALIQLWKNRFRLGFQDDSCWNQSRWEGMLIGFFFLNWFCVYFFNFFFYPLNIEYEHGRLSTIVKPHRHFGTPKVGIN